MNKKTSKKKGTKTIFKSRFGCLIPIAAAQFSVLFFSTCSSFILRLLFLSIEITVNTQKVLQSTNCTIFKSIEKRRV